MLRLGAGRPVFRQGEAVSNMYLLEAGQVRLVRNTADGARIVLHRVRPGEFLAENTLFTDTYSSDALSHTAIRFRTWPRATLLAELSRVRPPSVLRGALDHLREARMSLELRNIRSAPARVAAWLSLHAAGDPPALQTAQSWTVTAEELGLRREVVYRALTELQRIGRIRREGRMVYLNPPGPDEGIEPI